MGTALACAVGELIMMVDDIEQGKNRSFRILDAYLSTGVDGARIGADTEPSIVRRARPWPLKG